MRMESEGDGRGEMRNGKFMENEKWKMNSSLRPPLSASPLSQEKQHANENWSAAS